jgi:hypothetical protein
MSAAVRVPVLWGAASTEAAWDQIRPSQQQKTGSAQAGASRVLHGLEPEAGLAFYRKHTESLLRRYLYASMQVGRTPSMLGDTVGRGWASCTRVRTFEDAVIFVLDVETCLDRLSHLERQLLSRVVLQDYTYSETASMMGMAFRTVCYKVAQALDRLTQYLLDAGLLVIPH